MLTRSILRRLPIPDFWKTRLWGRALSRRPRLGTAVDAPYYRGLELALRGVASGYGVQFPKASAYSILEFGVAGGASMKALLHFRDVWSRTLNLNVPVVAVGFDTFEGLPDEREGDAGPWRPGDFSASLESVQSQLTGFTGWRLVKGLISESLPSERAFLEQNPPVFVSIDVDYYSSTVDVFTNLLDLLPNGAMVYFDDPAAHWFSDRFGELRAIRETNEGRYGSAFSFAEYPLWIETGELRHFKQLWRFVNTEKLIGGTAEPQAATVRERRTPL